MRRSLGRVLCVVLVACAGIRIGAQFEMPDPRQMAGIPRPVTDLPDGGVSVRVIRGQLSNNISNQPVEIQSAGRSLQTMQTGEDGRAEFTKLGPGTLVKAVAVVDGERLESQEFPVPAQGGVRLLLVATPKDGAGSSSAASAVAGDVALGDQSRIAIEPGEDTIRVYYLLEIVNRAQTSVTPSKPLEFDLPEGAMRPGLLEGSSPLASVDGRRVRVAGPIPSGRLLVRVAYELSTTGASMEIAQAFPAVLEQLGVIVRKLGSMRLSSPQLASQQTVNEQGETFIAGVGASVAAGQSVVLSIDDLPHHSSAPVMIAIGAAVLIVVGGVWIGARPAQTNGPSERQRLVSRREKLMNELVRLEADHRKGRVEQARYTGRRNDLVSALELIYGALDNDEPAPHPAGGAGVAA